MSWKKNKALILSVAAIVTVQIVLHLDQRYSNRSVAPAVTQPSKPPPSLNLRSTSNESLGDLVPVITTSAPAVPASGGLTQRTVYTTSSLFSDAGVIAKAKAKNKKVKPVQVDVGGYTNSLPPIQIRADLAHICEVRGFKKGLEIGVQRAGFSTEMLDRWKSCEKYYLVDPWEHQDATYTESANVNQAEQNARMKIARDRMQPYQNANNTRIELVRGYSQKLVDRFADKDIDFIYIDARHDYCSVTEDLTLYWPKVSCGGIFAGHDYMTNDEVQLVSSDDFGKCPDGSIHKGAVRAAVEDFFRPLGIQVMITYREIKWNTWYAIKTCGPDLQPASSGGLTPAKQMPVFTTTSYFKNPIIVQKYKKGFPTKPYKFDISGYTNSLPPIQIRADLAHICEVRGFKKGLEIGVQRAGFSMEMLSQWSSCEKYYLVDPWEQQDATYTESANVNQAEQNARMKIARDRVQPYQNADNTRIELVRGYSQKLVDRFADKDIDFIYIDARHDYCSVTEDLTLYWPKVSCGGIFAGHDYMTNDEVQLVSSDDFGKCPDGSIHKGAVRAAVEDFFRPLGIQVMITYREPKWNTWFVLKQCS